VRLAQVIIGCVALAVPMLHGCMSPEQQLERATQIRTANDQFKPYREYMSGEMVSSNAVATGNKALVARVDRKTGAVTTLLEFHVVYNDTHRRLYETARNSRAELLQLTTVQRQGQCRYGTGNVCPYSDLFTVFLPEQQLRAAGPEGYPIKIFARNGPDLLIAIPKPLITSLFAKVDADKAGGEPAVAARKAS
jgi:outer membrane murein-binding lipoprotein Lpp